MMDGMLRGGQGQVERVVAHMKPFVVPLSICLFLCSVGHGHALATKGLSSKKSPISTLSSVRKSHTDTDTDTNTEKLEMHLGP